MNKKVIHVVLNLFTYILLLYFYTLLHEGGHALVAMLCGGKVDTLVLGFNAHVQTSGASFTVFSEALFMSMGALLPVIFLIVALSIYKPKITSTYYHMLYGYLSLMIVSSLIAWIIIPFISLFTIPPAGDDVTRFLNITNLHPFIVMLVALIIIAALVFFIHKRGLIEKVKEMNYKLVQEHSCKNRKIPLLRLFMGILLAVIVVVVGFGILTPKPVFETSFSMQVISTNQNYKLPFKVDKSKFYKMNLELQAEGILTDIQIYTDSGTLMYQTVSGGFTFDGSLELEKGNYVFILTSLKNPSDMQEHFDAMGYMFEEDVLERYKEIYKENSSVENHSVFCSVTIK